MKRRAFLHALGLCALLFAAGVQAQEKAPPLTVFAAASLKEAMDEAGAAWQRQSGRDVRTSYAASSALARQVEQGAPADVFISADSDWMDYLQQRSLIDVATRRDLLGNTLVLVAPKQAKAKPLALRKGTDLLPLLGKDGRIALALTASVPAGKYAKASLTALGVWDGVSGKLAQAENVRTALQYVARGESPLGIVYDTDAKVEPRVRIVGLFPDATHPRIVYPAAVVAASKNPDAVKFLTYMSSPAAAAIFQKYGFKVLPRR